MKEVLIRATVWINWKSTMLSEIYQSEQVKCYKISLCWKSSVVKCIEMESKVVFARGGLGNIVQSALLVEKSWGSGWWVWMYGTPLYTWNSQEQIPCHVYSATIFKRTMHLSFLSCDKILWQKRGRASSGSQFKGAICHAWEVMTARAWGSWPHCI